MKKILLGSLLLFNLSYGDYSFYFSGIKLGNSKTFDTLNDNYLEADVTNKIAKFLLRRDKFIFFNENFTLPKDEAHIKYKKDGNQIIEILKRAVNNKLDTGKIILSNNKYIIITFERYFRFIYVSNEEIKSKGHFIIENGKLTKFVEEKNRIEIIKN